MRNNCAKCGSLRLIVKYDKALDMLDRRCLDCDFAWHEFPKDATQERLQTALLAKHSSAGEKHGG